VLFACQQRMADEVAARGFEVAVTLPPGRTAQRLPLTEPDRERELAQVRSGFTGGFVRERVASLSSCYDGWGPDAVVYDESDRGAQLAAELAGLPHVAVHIHAAGTFFSGEQLVAAAAPLRRELGLPADPPSHMAISPFPPSFRDPADPAPALAIRLGDAPLADGDAVYFTLGTVFNLESGDLFSRVLEGLRGRRVIATVGRAIDPAELGPQPPEVRIEQFVEQAAVLPECCAVVSHGGSGSLLGALAHGLPSVLLAMGADQMDNAARAEQVGVARLLHPVRASPSDVAAAVDEVIADPSYREAAAGFHREIAALPGPEGAVELIGRSPRGIRRSRRSGPGGRRSRPARP
jgi:hypothetical protein